MSTDEFKQLASREKEAWERLEAFDVQANREREELLALYDRGNQVMRGPLHQEWLDLRNRLQAICPHTERVGMYEDGDACVVCGAVLELEAP